MFFGSFIQIMEIFFFKMHAYEHAYLRFCADLCMGTYTRQTKYLIERFEFLQRVTWISDIYI